MNDQELAVLKASRGPSATLKQDADDYMRNSKRRKEVDSADAANGTSVGPKLRRIFYGQPEEVPVAPTQAAPPSAIELANAVRLFPKERCVSLFQTSCQSAG